MNGNSWHSSQRSDYSQYNLSPEVPIARVAADSVQDAHRLLSVYPFASATPSAHVVRHLSNLSISAAPPSYVYPYSYTTQAATLPQSHHQQYTEYANELNHLASSSMNVDDGGYWESTRNNAVRYLGEQGSAYNYYQQPSSQWSQMYPHPHSNHTPTPFAQSVFQHTAPSAAYPTPPPPGIISTSSSLAYALGDPNPKPPKTTYRAEDSAQFFDNFIAEKKVDIEARNDMPATPKRERKFRPAEESPDPLAIARVTPRGPVTGMTTPRKRKAMEMMDSPLVKRVQMAENLFNLHPKAITPLAQMRSMSIPKAGTSTTPKHSASPTPKRLQPFIEVPPLPKAYFTPKSQRRRNVTTKTAGQSLSSDEDDLGGFGSEDISYPPGSQGTSRTGGSVKSSSRRTGGRDDRAPLEKLMLYIEDIFEAEDSLPPDADINDLPSDFFSPFTVDCSHPLLHPNIVRKLTSYISKVTRPGKRLRLSSRDAVTGNGGTPRSKCRMVDVDANILSRVLRLLERSVKAGEDLDPFGTSTAMYTSSDSIMKSPSKRATKAAKRNLKSDQRSKSKTPKPADDTESVRDNTEEMDVVEQSSAPSDLDIEMLSRNLEIARDSVLAADCCMSLLSSDRLTKQLYSEELITTCLSTVKNQLTKIVYPFVETSSDLFGHVPPLLRYIMHSSPRDCGDFRRQLAEIFQALSSVIPRITDLISTEAMAMSEGIIIQAVYIAIGPFFVVDAGDEGKGKKDNVVINTLGTSAMRGLRLDALSLIRSVFANHEDQRSWIIEEILTSLIKLSDTKQKAGQFRLRDGRSIRTVSALLLQLVQTSAHDVRVDAAALHKARQQLLGLRRREVGKSAEPFLDEKDMEEIRLYISGLDSATKAAKTIILFLTQRSGKGKVTKNSNEAEYRTIFDNLISDLLTVLFWPEWPAASLLLSIACKFMVSCLDDVKTTGQNDNNAAKTMALDHLGVIAARLRASILKFRDDISGQLKPIDETLSGTDIKQLQTLTSAHHDLTAHLCKHSSEDQAYDSARELSAVVWGQELALTLKQCGSLITDTGDEEFDPKVDRSKIFPFGLKVKDALRTVWDDTSTDVFDISTSHEEVARIDRLSEEIGITQNIRNTFNPILNVVLLSLDAPPVFMRTKALKALGLIVTSDPSILSTPNVRHAIESHLLDSSPAVRDAAVELIGKYMIDSPEFAGDYYQRIADRIADTGLGVRKRVIKLLKSFYGVTEDRTRRADICTRLVLRMLDEDDTVKDLAVKTLEELWFQSHVLTTAQKARDISRGPHDKAQLLAKVTIIMDVSSNFKDRQSPLEDILHQIIAEKDGGEAVSLHDRYIEVCEALIDGLVDASDLPGFTVVNCVRTIYLFTSAYPAVLSGTNASTLLPYLKNATTLEEQLTSDYLLRIFRASIPHMPKTAAKFGQELQLALQPMILKPSTSAGLMGLQETVACMCAIVQHLTHDFGRLGALLKSCNSRLQLAINKSASQKMTPPEQRALSILIYIASLLCEHCEFDRLKLEQPNLRAELDAITSDSVIEHFYNSLLRLYEKYTDGGMRGRILQCLGFLFRAQPALMTADPSSKIMDMIFASPEEEARGRLLRILQEFLVSEAAKHTAKEKAGAKIKLSAGKVDMEELVGNTDGFADSGVSSAVVQRYLDPILEAALSSHAQIQASAVDILSFTIKQGLAHPLQSFPVIVALETSPIPSLSTRANVLHAVLHSKHTSLLNARYVASARTSFDYQKKLSSANDVHGYRMLPSPTALLQRWYSLVREKRATRQDFLRALVKVFDVESSAKASQDDVDFTRYMVENFSSFDYKTQEEVLTIIKYLTAVLSTTGMQLVETLSPAHLLTELHSTLQAQAQPVVNDNGNLSPLTTPPSSAPVVTDQIPLMRTTVIVAMIMLLKSHLKGLYGLSEEKCSKWVVGKKSAVGDRPATRRNEKPISWERLPFATTPILTNQDVDSQRTRFLEIWSEDGLSAEPEDDFA